MDDHHLNNKRAAGKRGPFLAPSSLLPMVVNSVEPASPAYTPSSPTIACTLLDPR
jgi:hypothetical protein